MRVGGLALFSKESKRFAVIGEESLWWRRGIAADPSVKDENSSATLNSQKSKISWFAVL
jgi:hypothetical protein